ncbi:MAG: hypothetical protein WDM81_13640 [Rhizomicrobium sp.]
MADQPKGTAEIPAMVYVEVLREMIVEKELQNSELRAVVAAQRQALAALGAKTDKPAVAAS